MRSHFETAQQGWSVESLRKLDAPRQIFGNSQPNYIRLRRDRVQNLGDLSKVHTSSGHTLERVRGGGWVAENQKSRNGLALAHRRRNEPPPAWHLCRATMRGQVQAMPPVPPGRDGQAHCFAMKAASNGVVSVNSTYRMRRGSSGRETAEAKSESLSSISIASTYAWAF